ncbi:MAG: hypothetical protein HY901_07790 [Deltaproteobacteria bacterium]|nr:hypothetical protein [Deltaproteobacteria bacterium]
MAVEKAVVLGLFSIRKLIDSNKISIETSDMRLRATAYPSNGKRVTVWNNHRLEELFDFKRGAQERLPLRFVCNQAIHSHILAVYLSSSGGRLVGLYVASDQHRKKALLAVPLVELERAFRRAGNDYPSFIHSVFDEARGDYIVTSHTRRPSGLVLGSK